MNQKGLVPFLIVLLIAATLGGYLVYKQSIPKPVSTPPTQTSQPSPSPTPTDNGEAANWKTYNESGFSFKYPESWGVVDFKKYNTWVKPNEIYIGLENTNLPVEEVGIIILMTNDDLEKAILNEETRRLSRKSEVYENITVISKNEESFNDYPITKIVFGGQYTDNTGHKVIASISCYFIAKNQRTYSVCNEMPGNILVDQILSTFKFLP